MYSLLVSSVASEKKQGTIRFDRSRFLEYTDKTIRTQLTSLSNEAIECLCSWPCIFMQEGRTNEQAYIVQITRVAATENGITIELASVLDKNTLTNDMLWKMQNELDIAEFEFSRNHWAVKDKDLWSALLDFGVGIEAPLGKQFLEKPLPAPTRTQSLRARDAIAGWGHTKIDDLILEVGVPKLGAGRELGSRRDRANAILQFSWDNPDATTAENSLLSAYLVRKAFDDQTEQKIAINSITPPVLQKPQEIDATNDSEARVPNRVFIVHGHNERSRDDVVTFLASLGLQGIVLHEQPNMGRHLLTKFIQEAELVTFAVVLMTDDDVGGAKNGTQTPRARQNVILELGYFLAHLGQPRVCALITPGLETPSDFDGIVYIQMNSDDAWKKELARELKAASMPLHPK